ncbi:aaa-atpase [Quercus suber]|uniref:Aaa-atpase n=1 Tax=Quercus suber TaxID=58331 RepID=A0AAW0JCL2_QUESU
MLTFMEMLTSLVTAAGVIVLCPLVKGLVPCSFRNNLFSIYEEYFCSPKITLFFRTDCGLSDNQMYDVASTYLRTKIVDSSKHLNVGKTVRQEKPTFDVVPVQRLLIPFKALKGSNGKKGFDGRECRRYFTLSFDKKLKEVVLESYLPEVISRSKAIQESERVLKLYSRDFVYGTPGREWSSIILEHPTTFEKLAMDPEQKRMLKDDLDKFISRKEWYKKVGKAWKRGYLLYGPPGTGKSSLIAAMANYLKFDVYDLDLTSIRSDSALRRIFLSTSNRSIMVIEDIDCAKLEDRDKEENSDLLKKPKFTLSGLLNFIDGVWSSCGEERIIVFTTNHKEKLEKLDPALLRPGRMDMHVHMSYLTMDGFKQLVSNYLGINGDHQLFEVIEALLKNKQVTPAEIAEELLKSEDPNVALRGVVEFLGQK